MKIVSTIKPDKPLYNVYDTSDDRKKSLLTCKILFLAVCEDGDILGYDVTNDGFVQSGDGAGNYQGIYDKAGLEYISEERETEIEYCD